MRSKFLVTVISLLTLVATAVYLYVFRFEFAPAPTARIAYWNNLFMQVFWVAVVVAVLVWGLILYALWRFRAKPGGPPEGPHIHGNTKMEIAWTIAPAVVMGWLLVVSFHGLFEIDTLPESPDFTVKITASQFSWTFEYPDGTTGLGPGEPLYLEQNRLVVFDITATDVIHAFSVPELGIMKDAIPGRVNHDSVQATIPGSYDIKCRELCGVGHSYMLGQLIIFPEGNQSRPYGPPPKPAPTGVPATTPASTTSASIPPGAESLPIILAPGGAFIIDPKTASAKVGPVAFEVKNEGDVVHNLYVGTFDTSLPDNGAIVKTTDMTGGASEVISFTFEADKTYEMWCNIGGHRLGFGQAMSSPLVVGKGSAVEIEKPLLPGFELAGLGVALLAVVVALRRRK